MLIILWKAFSGKGHHKQDIGLAAVEMEIDEGRYKIKWIHLNTEDGGGGKRCDEKIIRSIGIFMQETAGTFKGAY